MIAGLPSPAVPTTPWLGDRSRRKEKCGARENVALRLGGFPIIVVSYLLCLLVVPCYCQAGGGGGGSPATTAAPAGGGGGSPATTAAPAGGGGGSPSTTAAPAGGGGSPATTAAPTGGGGSPPAEPAEPSAPVISYVDSVPSATYNIPLLFSDEYDANSGWSSYAFAITAAAQFPNIIVPFNGTAGSSLNARLQVGWSASFGIIDLENVKCSSYVGASGVASQPQTFGNGACGSLVTCVDSAPYTVMLPNAAAGGSNPSSLFQSATLSVGTAYYANDDDLCDDVLFTAILTTSVPILSKPQSAYVALAYNLSALSNESASAASAIASTPAYWNGSGTVHLTRSPQVVTMQASITSKPDARLCAFQPDAAAADAEVDTITLSNTTSLTSECIVHDVSSYTMTRIAAGTYGAYDHDCDTVYYDTTITTISALQFVCDADAACLGFTSYLQNVSGTLAERPHCILRLGSDDDGFDYPRMVYKKRTDDEKTCSAITEYSGDLQVWVEQTSSSSSTVDVFVNGFYERSCGSRASPFASSVGGSSGFCGVYNLCFSGKTYPGAVVSVVPQSTFAVGSSSSNCTGAFHVIFSQTAIDPTPSLDTRPRYAPPSDLASNFSSRFTESLYVSIVTEVTPVIRIYARNVEQLALGVYQTAYSCDGDACIDEYIAFSAPPTGDDGGSTNRTVQTCGGKAKFGNYSGLNDQCSTLYYCGGALAVPKGSVSGSASWLSLAVDAVTIYSSASKKCKFFSATVYGALNNFGESDEPSGFVLKAAASVFRTLMAAPSGTSEAEAVNRTFQNATPSSAVSAKLLDDISVGPLDSMSVYYVDWKSIVNANLSNTAALACVMDWISTTTATCTIMVPSGANYVTVRVEQSTFSAENNVITVNLNKRAERSDRVEASSSITCGGESGFSGKPSEADACGVYLNCTDRFIYDDDTFMQSAPVVSLTISVPQSVSSTQPCKASAVIVAEFAYLNVTKPDECEYFCTASRRCIAYDRVCDGVIDCPDEADESQCTRFSIADQEMRFNDSSATNITDLGYLGCVRRAVAGGNKFFAHNTDDSVCYLYSEAQATTMAAAADSYLINASGTTLYRQTGAVYSRCTSVNTCSGHGTVVMVQNRCNCFCNDGYYGPACGEKLEMTTFGGVVITFNSRALEEGGVSVEDAMSECASVIELMVAVPFVCDAVARDPNDVSLTNIYCHPSGILDDYSLFENSVTAKQSFNWKIQAEFSKATAVGLFSVPVFSPIPSCTLSSNASCAMPSDIGLRNVVVTWKQTGMPNLAVQVQSEVEGSASRRRSGSSSSSTVTTSLVCDQNTTVVQERAEGPNCGSFSCMLPVGLTDVSSLVATVNATNTPQCTPVVTSVSYSSVLAVTSIAEPTSISNVYADFTPFLIAGALLLGLAVAIMVASSVMFVTDKRAVNNLTQETRHSSLSDLHKLLRISFLQMGYYEDQASFIRKERWSVALFVVAVNLVIAGTFLVLYFATGTGFTSSASIIVEQYLTSQCGSSSTSSLAFSAFIIDGTTAGECVQRQVVGATTTPLYASGYCEQGGGTGPPSARLRVGTSESLCRAAAFSTVPSGSCLLASSLIPSMNGTMYVSVRCGDPAALQQLSSDYAALSESVSLNASIRTELLPASKEQHWDDASLEYEATDGATVYQFRGIRASFPYAPTSSMSECYESSSASAPDDGNAARHRLLVMVPEETFTPPSKNNYFPLTTALENANWKYYNNLTGAPITLGPQDGDLPLGRVYNRFNTSTALSGPEASAQSARYYGMEAAAADIGASYGEDTDVEDGDGFTITMYLRVTGATLGFAFAVTDAYEDISSRSSPALDKAIDMLTRKSPPDVWFSSAYHIYSSLYVNGPASSLHFIHANPSTTADGNESSSDALSERFVDVKWDMEELNLQHLFNGLWHHVAVVLRSENDQTKAQLVVDGETSLSKTGWNQCMSRRPTKIQNISAGLSVPAYSASKERFMSGGMLYTGYFNGGIGHLQFRSEVVPLFDILRESTVAVQERNRLGATKYLILGYSQIVIAVLLFAAMIVHSGKAILRVHAADKIRMFSKADLEYSKVMKPVPSAFKRVDLSTAIKWLDVDGEQVLEILEELGGTTQDPAAQFMRILFNVRSKQVTSNFTPMLSGSLSVAEWNTFVDQQLAPTTSAQNAENACVEIKRTPLECLPLPTRVEVYRAHPNRPEEDDEDLEDCSPGKEESEDEEEEDTIADLRKEAHEEGGDVETDLVSMSNVPNLPIALKELFAPILMVVQSLYVWLTSMPMPDLYDGYFKGPFSFVTLDWAVAFSIPTIVTPLLQFFAGICVFGLIVYYSKLDEYRFAWHLARYTLKRDQLEATARDRKKREAIRKYGTAEERQREKETSAASYVQDLVTAFPQSFGKQRRTTFEYDIAVLPVKECQKVDDMLNISYTVFKAKVVGHEEDEGADNRREVQTECSVTSDDGKTFTLASDPATRRCWSTREQRIDDVSVAAEDPAIRAAPLSRVGVCCHEHVGRRLTPQIQTNVYPFVYQPSCCVVVNGVRCNVRDGEMFHCGHKEINDADDSFTMCEFALCDRHYRATFVEALIAEQLTPHRKFEREGWSWLLVTLAYAAANAAYTPFMQTALMILACSPFYQCEFEKCWGSTMDQKFSLAVYLCLVIVVLLGVGLPLLQTLQLWRCRKMMELAFFAEEYDGAYEEREDEDEEMVAVSEARPLREVPATPTAAPAAPAKRRLKLDEWIRFTSSDPTVMGTLYKTLTFEWMFMSPIILAWKIIIIVPAVFLPADTFEQRVGIAAAQVAFSLFIFATSPFISPLVDAMYRLSCIHQVLFLGVESLSVVRQYEGNGEYGMALVLITMSYICTAVGGLLWGMVGPVVREFIIRKTSETVLASFGLHYSMTTSVFVVPDMATGIKRTERTAVEDNFEL